MSTYGDLKKAWAREWTRLRREYLDGKVLDAVVLPSRTGVRGECPVCGAVGTDVTSSRLATTAGRNHMQNPHQRRRPRRPGRPQGHLYARGTTDALPTRPPWPAHV